MRRTYTERLERKQFRMTVVNRIKDLCPAERKKEIDRILTERHMIPFSGSTSLSRATIYRWLKEFRDNRDVGSALMGKVRSDIGKTKALTAKQKDALVRWRYDGPYRTLGDLRKELMEHESTWSDPLPSESTIGRYLNSLGLSRRELLKGVSPQAKIRLAFEAEYPQQLWMGDTKGPDVYVEDPENPGSVVKAVPVTLIDDNSRYIVAARYVIVENEQVIMELFSSAVLLYGIPEMLYFDHGGSYTGKSLKKAASIIGCNVIHAPVRDGAAKGKIEKLLRTVHERFEHEMEASGKKSATLREYNEYLRAYIGQEYHREVHSSTGQTPEERFFSFPADLRRWISKDCLAMISLPVRTAVVSKVGLVSVDKVKYLVSDSHLWCKKVEVRSAYSDKSKVYVWYEDKYYGEAYAYEAENDYAKRREIEESIVTPREITIPAIDEIPLYGRLDRLLAKHRSEVEGMNVNEQITQSRKRKEETRAVLAGNNRVTGSRVPERPGEFGSDDFLYLLAKLLRIKLTPSDRLSAHTLWNSAGPLEEKLVRETVGRLLGEEHPTEDINGYLEQIRLAVITKNK